LTGAYSVIWFAQRNMVVRLVTEERSEILRYRVPGSLLPVTGVPDHCMRPFLVSFW